jgi:hypothetical protein
MWGTWCRALQEQPSSQSWAIQKVVEGKNKQDSSVSLCPPILESQSSVVNLLQ